MYLRREEMGAGTAGARRWLVPTALVSNTMRREQRLHHEKRAEVAGSGGSRGCSSHTCRENDVAGLVPFRRMWPEGEYGSSERKTGVPGDELAFLATCDHGSMELSHLFLCLVLARTRLFLVWHGRGLSFGQCME